MMKNRFIGAFSFAKDNPYTSIAGVFVVVGLVWFFGFRTSGSTEETMVVHPSRFVQQISVSGSVKASQDVNLAFSQGGRIGRVPVAVGAQVYAGQILAEVENGDIRAQVLQKEAALENAKAKLATLQAGTRPEEIALAQSEVTQDKAALINALNTAYTVADDAVHNKTDEIFSNPRTNPQLSFNTSNSQLKSSVESERATLEQAFASWQIQLLSVANDNLSDSVRMTQKNLSIVSQYLISINAILNSAITNQTVSQTTLNTYTSDVATARTNVNTTTAALATAVSALDTATRNLTIKQAGTTQTDIDAQAAQVKGAQADLANTEAQLLKTLIVAPFSGVVTKVDAKVGQTAAANTGLISLISVGTYQIESYIPEVNVAFVKVGDSAQVTLDAYGAGVLFAARVISIDPASEVRDGVSMYRSILQFNENDPRIRSGMTASVTITTDERDGVIGVPKKVVHTESDAPYVYVLEDGVKTKRIVTTGVMSSVGVVEILSGLSDGDTVVLSQ